MRESTRKIYARQATAFFSEPWARAGLENGRIFDSLEVQNYLFAELGRPCLRNKHGSRNHFCCIRRLLRNTAVLLGHQLGPRLVSPQTPIPLAVYEDNFFLYDASDNGRFLAPFRQQRLFSHYRRNLFVVRNLHPATTSVTLRCPRHSLYRLSKDSKRRFRGEITLELEAADSAVVLLSPGTGQLLDEPVEIKADNDYVLVFYLADAVEQQRRDYK